MGCQNPVLLRALRGGLLWSLQAPHTLLRIQRHICSMMLSPHRLAAAACSLGSSYTMLASRGSVGDQLGPFLLCLLQDTVDFYLNHMLSCAFGQTFALKVTMVSGRLGGEGLGKRVSVRVLRCPDAADLLSPHELLKHWMCPDRSPASLDLTLETPNAPR